MRTTFYLLSFVLILLQGIVQSKAHGPTAEDIEIFGTPLPFDRLDPFHRVEGKLRWIGGLDLTTKAEGFGGFSGLLIEDNGTKLIAISDKGRWLQARLIYDTKGSLQRLEAGKLGWLRDDKDKLLDRKSLQDAESLTRLANGDLVVGFERRHRLWLYPATTNSLEGPASDLPFPRGLISFSDNLGLEALLTLHDNRLFAITENLEDDSYHALLQIDGGWEARRILDADNHRPTGATLLPSGDILVVERRFRPPADLSIRIRRISLAELANGNPILGEEVARLSPPLSVDNMEGIAAWQDHEGRTIVAMISDDNFNPIQRNLLILFELLD